MRATFALDGLKHRDSAGMRVQTALDIASCAIAWVLLNDGTPITQVSVTYQNNGNSQASFNPYDWKAEDAQGAQRSQAFYTDGENELNSGTLAAGGTVSGNLYFEGDVVKVLYENAFIGRGSDISWDIV